MTLDTDIEDFTRNLGVAIWDLNKKHNGVLYRTNLGNHLCPFIRFIKFVKEDRDERTK